MDILALPDVFLRMLMTTMTIKDRLRLRQTCNASDQLVANKDAGAYDRGEIVFYDDPNGNDSMLLLKIGGEHGVEATDEEFVVAIVLIHRLWSRISFEEFRIELSDHDDPSDYVKWSVEKFEIKLFQFRVSYEPQLHSILQIISDHPSSQYTMIVCSDIFPQQKHF
uniref:F-box domain-containing protein n=1 Tax=Pristionchus pacificus TaxID=54126 RepID=A0A8R1U5S1_PRIPA